MPGRARNYSGPSTYTRNNSCGPSTGRRRHYTHNADQNRSNEANQPAAQFSSNRGRRSRAWRSHHNSENRNSYEMNQSSQPAAVQMNDDGMPEYPGLYWDPVKKLYFGISAGAHTGISEYTPTIIAKEKEHRQLKKEVDQHRQAMKSQPRLKSMVLMQSSMSHPYALPKTRGLALQRGDRHMNLLSLRRKLAEARLTNVNTIPNYVYHIEDSINFDTVENCKFLKASDDATSIFGCWSSKNVTFTNYLKIKVDNELKKKAFYEMERTENSVGNTMGLVFSQRSYSHNMKSRQIVDMCIAPIDSEVIGCLSVTVSSHFHNNQLRSRCHVQLNPILEWSYPENDATLDSPIYNISMSNSSQIWSCGWSSNNMYISLGMLDKARICDIRAEKRFTISSKGKKVIHQKFTPDGNIIIMCPNNSEIMCSDLRMFNKHWIDSAHDWPQTKNSCFVQPLKNQFPNHVLTQGFDGQLKLWDLRQKTSPVMSYSGHKNNGYKLSCITDPDERFVFAVGSDSCVRGWSLSSGELLCELPPTQPLYVDPQIAYSDNWGGVVGNTALVVAHGSSINVHQLDL